MSEKLLEIKDEKLSFFTPAGEVKALNGVSFSMDEGEVLGIVGESGSGKSVTAYSIMGLTAYPGKLIGGTIRFNGHEIEKMTDKDFRKIRGNEVSIIFQDPMTSLNPVYTIGNQITEVIRLHTDKDKKQAYERAKELLELVGINEPLEVLKQRGDNSLVVPCVNKLLTESVKGGELALGVFCLLYELSGALYFLACRSHFVVFFRCELHACRNTFRLASAAEDK